MPVSSSSMSSTNDTRRTLPLATTSTTPDLASYDHFLVMVSGGKDSVGCHLELEAEAEKQGCLEHVRERAEWWHHEIDGREGSDLMDWRCTPAYIQKLADGFGVPLYFSWRVGGFEQEMLRHESATAQVLFETPENGLQGNRPIKVTAEKRARLARALANLDATRAALPAEVAAELEAAELAKKITPFLTCLASVCSGETVLAYLAARAEVRHARKQAGANTRRMYPAKTASLMTRWCSAYCKIMVGDAAIANQPRFKHTRVLVLTGERAEESSARAKYQTFEAHKTTCKSRHVDHWRPVHGWSNDRVWAELERAGVNPHPAYRLGFGRTSCQFCIFQGADHWATHQVLSPERFETIARFEDEFGHTIDAAESVRDLARRGSVLPAASPEVAAEADDAAWNGPAFLPAGEWTRPAGADADQSCGAS